MNDTQKLCRLCLKELKNHRFEYLGDPTWDTLNALNMKIYLDIKEELVICRDCSENLHKLSTFKVMCVETENRLLPFINLETNEKIDLPQVYLKLNGGVTLGDMNICRFCMCKTRSNFSVYLNVILDVMSPIRNLLENFFPELDLSLVRDPIVCKRCHHFLQEYLIFTSNCTTLEHMEKYAALERIHGEGKIHLRNKKPFFEEVVIKQEIEDIKEVKHEMQQNDDLVEDLPTVTAKESENHMQIEDSVLNIKNEEAEFKLILDNSERAVDSTCLTIEDTKKQEGEEFNRIKNAERFCGSLASYNKKSLAYRSLLHDSFETKRKHNVAPHELVHEDLSEVTLYKCENEDCSFETKHKKNLYSHRLVHKNLSEVTIYKCENENCSYETKRKRNLYNHRLVHKDLSEVIVYKCKYEGCSYEAKRRSGLSSHKLIHMDSSKVTIYKCEVCSLQTKYKGSLVKHQKRQNCSSTGTIYKCENSGCSYETKSRGSLSKHRLIHKDSSEAIMHQMIMKVEFDLIYKKGS